jgi:hypothetical protein
MIIAGLALQWVAVSGAHLYDTGELVAAAWSLGGSHPPGQPLHALLGHALAWLPLGPIAWRVSAVSVLGALLSAWYAGRITAALVTVFDRGPAWARRLAPDVTALAVLLSPPVARQATRPEVYTVALALTLYAVLQLLHWAMPPRKGNRELLRAAAATGLLGALHLPHALSVLAFAAVAVSVARSDVLGRPRAWPWIVLAGTAGLGVYSYLPLRGMAGAPMWGDPTTGSGFWRYVSGKAYQANLGASGSAPWFELITDALAYVTTAGGFIPALGLAPLLIAGRRTGPDARRLGWLAAGGLLGVCTAAMLQPHEPSNPDNVAYAAPGVAVFVAMGVAGWVLFAHRQWSSALVACVLAVIAVNPPAWTRIREAVDKRAPALETLSWMLTTSPAPRALALVQTDLFGSSWMLARQVRGARPDMAWFASGLATSSWHWQHLASHPVYGGTPVLGPGKRLRRRYVRGAVGTATGKVQIVSEPDWPLRGRGAVAGPYLAMAPNAGAAERTFAAESTAERMWPVFEQQARGLEGDHGAVGAILRDIQMRRARRLLRRGHMTRGIESLAATLWWLPRSHRRALSAVQPRRVRSRPPIVRNPDSFFVSRADAVHEAAVWTWAAGGPETAVRLLEYQLDQDDPRALLQLAWLHASAGQLDRARTLHQHFVRRFPDLAGEAQALSDHLHGEGGP